MRMMSLLFFILLPLSAIAYHGVVNVYNWSDYLPIAVLKQFEKETNIRVNYGTYDSNEALYTKLKINPHGGYDVIFPSSYYVQRMIREHMLHRLNKAKLSNFNYLNPQLLNRTFDKNNRYSVPYAWGTTSIVINNRYYPWHAITQWQDLWQKHYRNQLLIVDDMRDVFAMAMQVLHYSINDTNPKHIYQAYLKLKALLPNIKLFGISNINQIYCDGDALIGMAQNEDAKMAYQCNPHIRYIYPQHQVILWMDSMAIPRYAPHIDNAYRFINFILQPKIAVMISRNIGASTPNLAAIKLMPQTMQNDPLLNPPASVLKQGQFEGYISDKATKLYARYWELLKLAA